ncbi:MAG: cyclase family protein [Bryobacteraceae bacterium]|nr:cyclase family protein [Bryobacteraceae bacterium]
MRWLVLALLCSCAPAQIDDSKLVDLTYDFDSKTLFWPTAKPFQWKKDAWGMSPGGYWYTMASFSASEHQGTHIDAPIHFAQDGATTEAIPLKQLVSPAVVVDITAQSAANRDYRLTPADLRAWEKANGRIPDGAALLVRAGWGRFWGDRKAYFGSDKAGDASGLHFPGVSKEAAEWLVKERRIDAIGIDTASIDYGPSRDFIAHRVLAAKGIYNLENVANLDKLPATGATLIALPMKIKGGTGGPVRIVAILR